MAANATALDIRVTPLAHHPNALDRDEPVASYGDTPRPRQGGKTRV
jgi:hypothetical protein